MSEHIQGIKDALGPLYGKTRFSYAEEASMCCLRRLPTHMDEVAKVVAYHASLKPYERKYFPQSLLRLLQDWESTCDKAYVSMQAASAPKPLSATDKILLTRELTKIEKRIEDLRAIRRGEMREAPTPLHKVELDKLKIRRAEIVGLIGMGGINE